jgi:hypothetical protein
MAPRRFRGLMMITNFNSKKIMSSQKRGRKPRGGIASLDDLLTTQHAGIAVAPAPTPSVSITTPSLSVATAVPENSFSVYEEVPWKQQELVHTFPTELTDEEIDELDMFPQDDVTDYEVLYRTQTSSAIHRMGPDARVGYTPMSAETGESTNAIPEHMRIIRLPPVSTVASVAAAAPAVVSECPPEMHHAFRIHGFTSEALNDTPLVLEDDCIWPQSSPFLCWWDSHSFTTYPKVVPVSIRGTNVQVCGNFCSWSCAKAYALKYFRTLEVFNRFYFMLFHEDASTVKTAQTPLCLKSFGGQLTIEEYRQSFLSPDRRISVETLSHLNVTVAKTFIHDNARWR